MMPVIAKKVETFQRILFCDDCGGEMKPTGTCLTSNPAQYPHECDGCGTVLNKWSTYPQIYHRVIDDE